MWFRKFVSSSSSSSSFRNFCSTSSSSSSSKSHKTDHNKNPFVLLWTRYLAAIEKRPLLVKSITCGVLSFGADVICQSNEQYMKKKAKKEEVIVDMFEYDMPRLFRFTFLGVVMVGPLLHYWYGFLCSKIPGTHLLPTVQRLACDQLLFAPFVILPAFFSANLILEGRPENIAPKLQSDWLSTVFANWALWVPCQFINFKLVPPHLQVLFSNSVGFVWNIYLSSVTNKVSNSNSDNGGSVGGSISGGERIVATSSSSSSSSVCVVDTVTP